MKPYPMPNIRTDAFTLEGGIHLNKSGLEARPGTLVECLNYEPYVAGGYQRAKGYERFDGSPRPSDGVWSSVACTFEDAHGLVEGDNLTCGAATFTFLAEVTGGMIVTEVVGTIPTNTAIQKSGVTKATSDASDTDLDYQATNLQDATWLNMAADQYRADIEAVPGEDDILGVWFYNDVVYAFRNAVGGATAKMYKSTSTGWTEVDLGYRLLFQTGTAAVSVGQTLTGASSGASCTVRRIEIRTGTWAGGTAAGIIVTDAITNGPFTTGENLQVGGVTKCVANGGSTAQTLQPDGRFEFVNGNFYGSTSTYRMYGCDGVNSAFEFDGTYFVPISTGASSDTPSFIEINSNHLFVSIGASAMHSETGEPHKWDAALTAGEIGFGDDINGFRRLPGQAFGVVQQNKISAILGTSSADWTVQTIAPDVGGEPYTIQSMGPALMVDDRGLIEVTAGQNYGNFDFSTVSRNSQTLFDRYRGKYVASCVARSKNQYRVFTNDGTILVMRVEPGKGREFGLLRYDDIPVCVCSEEGTDGQERIFFGTSSGMVYEAERGSSFDGDSYLSALVTWPAHAKSPTMHKTFRHAYIEVQSDLYSAIEAAPEFDYQSTDNDPSEDTEDTFLYSTAGAGGRWDSTFFDTFIWDGPYIDHIEMNMSGSGYAIAFVILCDSEIDLGHRIRAIKYTFTTRRQRR